MNVRYGKSLRLISLFLIVSFLGEQVVFAAEELRPIRVTAQQQALTLPYRFPASIAEIEDSYKAQGSARMIYLLQDAHTNESGQFNLARALDLILTQEKDLRYVFSEAGVEDNSLSFLRSALPLAQRRSLAERFVKQGLLHGTEFLDLTTDHSFRLWGVEDPALYNEALERYREVAGERERLEAYLKKIEATAEALKSRIVSPGLAEALEEAASFRDEKTSLTDYSASLSSIARIAGLSLEAHPNLNLLKSLREIEATLDFAAANRQQLEAMNVLSDADRKALEDVTRELTASKAASEAMASDIAFASLFKEKLGERCAAYPELSKYFEYMGEARRIQAKGIVDELRVLEEEVLLFLARSDEERLFIRAARMIHLLKKLFRFTLTPSEYQEYQGLSSEFSLGSLTGFFNKKIMDLKSFHDRTLLLEEGGLRMVENAVRFYTLTHERDVHFVEQALEKMSAERQTSAVLVAGGFHSSNLKALLKDRGVSYVSVVPQVLQETDLLRYERILFGPQVRQTVVSGAPAAMAMPRLALTGDILHGSDDLFAAIRQLAVTDASRRALESRRDGARLAARSPIKPALINGLQESLTKRRAAFEAEIKGWDPSADVIVITAWDQQMVDLYERYVEKLRLEGKIRADVPVLVLPNDGSNIGNGGMLAMSLRMIRNEFDRLRLDARYPGITQARKIDGLNIIVLQAGGLGQRFTAARAEGILSKTNAMLPVDSGDTVMSFALQGGYQLTQKIKRSGNKRGLVWLAGDTAVIGDQKLQDGLNLITSPESVESVSGRLGFVTTDPFTNKVRSFHEKEPAEVIDRLVGQGSHSERRIQANTANAAALIGKADVYQRFIEGLIRISDLIENRRAEGEPVYEIDTSLDLLIPKTVSLENYLETVLGKRKLTGNTDAVNYYSEVYRIVNQSFPDLVAPANDPDHTYYVDFGSVEIWHHFLTTDNPLFRVLGFKMRIQAQIDQPADVADTAGIYFSQIGAFSDVSRRAIVYSSKLDSHSAVATESVVAGVEGYVETAPRTLLLESPVRLNGLRGSATVYTPLGDLMTRPVKSLEIWKHMQKWTTPKGESVIEALDLTITDETLLSELPLWPVTRTEAPFDMSLVKWMFDGTGVAPGTYLEAKRISYSDIIEWIDYSPRGPSGSGARLAETERPEKLRSFIRVSDVQSLERVYRTIEDAGRKAVRRISDEGSVFQGAPDTLSRSIGLWSGPQEFSEDFRAAVIAQINRAIRTAGLQDIYEVVDERRLVPHVALYFLERDEESLLSRLTPELDGAIRSVIRSVVSDKPMAELLTIDFKDAPILTQNFDVILPGVPSSAGFELRSRLETALQGIGIAPTPQGLFHMTLARVKPGVVIGASSAADRSVLRGKFDILFKELEGLKGAFGPERLDRLTYGFNVSPRRYELDPNRTSEVFPLRTSVESSDASGARLAGIDDPLIKRLGPNDRIYIGTLRDKQMEGTQSATLKIGENFIPSSMLSEDQRQRRFGRFDYAELAKDPSNIEAAREVVLTKNILDGGLGEAVGRIRYKQKTLGLTGDEAKLGAKGTDLKYDLPDGTKVSVAEIKLNNALAHRQDYAQVIYRPIVSDDSKPSYESLFEQYRQQAREAGLELADEMLIAKLVPTVDAQTNEMTTEHQTTGGSHGQWGVHFLLDAFNKTVAQDGLSYMQGFMNGDGINNSPDRVIVGWAKKNNIPIVMISTEKTGLDRKGGIMGIQIQDGRDLSDPNTVTRAQMMELAQAKSVGQQGDFESVGLPGGQGQAGEQDFNTNIALLNESVLSPLLKDLVALIGEEAFRRIISPDLIKKDVKKGDKTFTQLEGALGSALLNLNAFFETSKDPRIKALLEKYGISRIVSVVYVRSDNRTRFFTPIKNSFDFWMQNYSDYYRLNTQDWVLEDVRPQHPPIVEIDFDKDKPYKDVQNLIDHFGRASTIDLKELHLKGQVDLKDAVLKGIVKVDNRTVGLIDLNQEIYRSQLPKTQDGRLLLENVTILIDEQGQMSLSQGARLAESGEEASWLQLNAPTLQNKHILEVTMEMALSGELLALLRQRLDADESLTPQQRNHEMRKAAMSTSVGGIGPLLKERVIAQSELGADVTGVSLLYDQVWVQRINANGDLELAKEALSGHLKEVLEYVFDLPIVMYDGRTIQTKVWRAPAGTFGRGQVYFFDPQMESEITRSKVNVVYPGHRDIDDDARARFDHSWILGRGALALTKKLERSPDLVVMSEASAMMAHHRVFKDAFTADPFFERTRYIFNDHTPLPYAHPQWDSQTLRRLKVDRRFFDEETMPVWDPRTGRVDATALMINAADGVFGVAKKHAQVMKEMELLRQFAEKITSVTNGVSGAYWPQDEFREPERVREMSDDELLAAKDRRRQVLIEFIAKRMSERNDGYDWQKWAEKISREGNPIGVWVRRIVEYKRLGRFADILENDRMRQEFVNSGNVFIVGGRIHQDDSYGVTQFYRIQRAIKNDPTGLLKERVIFFDNYNIWEAPILFSGADFSVMLADDGREASATGFQKAQMNGDIIIASEDGAVPESVRFYNGTNRAVANGILVPFYNGEPTADGLLSGLVQFAKIYRDKDLLSRMVRNALNQARRVSVNRTSRHMLEFLETVQNASDHDVRKIAEGSARAERVFLSIDLRTSQAIPLLDHLNQKSDTFIWRYMNNGTQLRTVTESAAGLSGFVDSIQYVLSLGTIGRWSLAYHANGQGGRGDIASYVRMLLKGVPALQPVVDEIDSIQNETPDEADSAARVDRDLVIYGFLREIESRLEKTAFGARLAAADDDRYVVDWQIPTREEIEAAEARDAAVSTPDVEVFLSSVIDSLKPFGSVARPNGVTEIEIPVRFSSENTSVFAVRADVAADSGSWVLKARLVRSSLRSFAFNEMILDTSRIAFKADGFTAQVKASDAQNMMNRLRQQLLSHLKGSLELNADRALLYHMPVVAFGDILRDPTLLDLYLVQAAAFTKQAYGRNVKHTFDAGRMDEDRLWTIVDARVKRLSGLYPNLAPMLGSMLEKRSSLEGHRDVHLVTPGRFTPQPGRVYLSIERPEPGDIVLFPFLLAAVAGRSERGALEEGFFSAVETSLGKAVDKIEYEKMLFGEATADQMQKWTEKYKLPKILKLVLDEFVQGARLVMQATGRSA